MDHAVGQVLIQVSQAVGILAQHLVLPSQPVSSSQSPKSLQVNHIECTDVVPPVTKMTFPVATFPEPVYRKRIYIAPGLWYNI